MEERLVGANIATVTTAIVEKIDRLNQELGESKAIVEAAGRRVSDVTDARAQEITLAVQNLTSALSQTGADLRASSEQSTNFAKRLNWLTAALVVSAIATALATGFYAWETKRQVDLMQRQVQNTTQPSPPAKQ
jgi:hypothetical protein